MIIIEYTYFKSSLKNFFRSVMTLQYLQNKKYILRRMQRFAWVDEEHEI